MRISDWSSDVCSSDLAGDGLRLGFHRLTDTAGRMHDVGDGRTDRDARVQRLPGRSLDGGDLRRNVIGRGGGLGGERFRSEEHTSELQSLMRISYAVFCLKKKKHHT